MSARATTPPFGIFERMLALRYLRPRRREGFISVIAVFSFLGILLGVAALIIVLSVMSGFRKELIGKILGVGGHVFVQAMDTPLDDYEAVAERLSRLPGVRFAIPVVNGQGLASSASAATGALIRGVAEADLLRLPTIAGNVRSGTLHRFDTAGGVALGQRLADHLGVRVGDTVTLLAPQGPASPFGQTPRRKSYPVIATFQIGMSEFDNALVYMPLAEAQLFFDKDGEVSVIELTLDDPEKAERAGQAAIGAAGRPVLVTDWRIRNESFRSALDVERNVMFIILTLIVLVAALNIISGLIMLVRSKARDIAILRTMGATRGAILRIFIMTGAAIGVTGTFAGLLVGVVFTLNIQAVMHAVSLITGTNLWDPTVRFLTTIPAEINLGEVLLTVTMALSLSLLATLYPAWRASTLDPVEALRHG